MADTSKTSFGLDQISNKTPEWANWIYRGWLIVSNAVTGFITGLAALQGIHISPVIVGVILLSINSFGVIVYGFSKLFGVVPEPVDDDKGFVADKQVDDKGNTNTIPETIVK